MMVQKDGQVTKPIIVVKMPKLLYIIQVKRFLKGYNFLALPDMQLGRQIEAFQNVGGLTHQYYFNFIFQNIRGKN